MVIEGRLIMFEFNSREAKWFFGPQNYVIEKDRVEITTNPNTDWATADIGASVKSMWYRLSRRESDYCLENSFDGINFKQMRIFHLFEGEKEINFGLLACSPSESSFKATFTEMKVEDCLWKEHKA
jgi:uncharacterized protein